MYDPKSKKAEEFISDEEIKATLAYADSMKDDIGYIESLLEKARPRRTEDGVTCAGLNHRENPSPCKHRAGFHIH